MQLLIIEDNHLKYERIVKAIEQQTEAGQIGAIEIHRAESTFDALENLQENTYDRVFLDMSFPLRTGEFPERFGGKDMLSRMFNEIEDTKTINLSFISSDSSYNDDLLEEYSRFAFGISNRNINYINKIRCEAGYSITANITEALEKDETLDSLGRVFNKQNEEIVNDICCADISNLVTTFDIVSGKEHIPNVVKKLLKCNDGDMDIVLLDTMINRKAVDDPEGKLSFNVTLKGKEFKLELSSKFLKNLASEKEEVKFKSIIQISKLLHIFGLSEKITIELSSQEKISLIKK